MKGFNLDFGQIFRGLGEKLGGGVKTVGEKVGSKLWTSTKAIAKDTPSMVTRSKSNANTVAAKVGIYSTILGKTWGAGLTLGHFLGGLIFAALLPFLVKLLERLIDLVTELMSRATRRFSRVDQSLTDNHSWRAVIPRIFLGLVKLIAKLFEAYVVVGLRYMLRNAFPIGVLFIITVMLYALRTHIASVANLYEDSAVLGVESLNFGSDLGNLMIVIQNTIAPMSNAAITSTALVVSHVHAGLNTVADAAPTSEDSPPDPAAPNGRRMLSGDSQFAAEAIVNFMAFYEIVMNMIVIVIVDIFMLVIWPILGPIITILIFVVTRGGCILGGGFCSLRELFHAILNDIILAGVAALFPIFFKEGPPRFDFIACGPEEFGGLSCVCAGNFLDFSEYGMYSRLPACIDQTANNVTSTVSRRALLGVRCYETDDGSFVEETNEESTHMTRLESEACPTAKRAFHPYTHAVDMQKWDVHTCISHCVRGVAMTSCDAYGNHTVSVMGSCDGADEGLDEAGARERLAFLGVDVSKLTTEVPFHAEPANVRRDLKRAAQRTREQRAKELKESTPEKFVVDGLGSCDFSRPPTDIFETVADLQCIFYAHKKSFEDFSPIQQSRHGRTLQGEGETNAVGEALSRASLDAAHWIRIQHHAIHADPEKVYDPLDRVSAWHLFKHFRKQQKKKTGTRRVLQETTKAADTDAPMPCLGEGMYFCEPTNECVSSRKMCDMPPSTWSAVMAASYGMNQAGQFVQNFDMNAMLSDALNCYTTRQDSEFWGSAGNVFRDQQVTIDDPNLKWCLGEIPPTDIRLPKLSYDAHTSVQSVCSGTENFQGCRCPDFFQDSLVEYKWKGVFSINVLRMWFNGLKWYALTIALASNSFVYFVARLYESIAGSFNSPNWMRISSHDLTHEETWKCWVLHACDGGFLLLSIVVLYGFFVSSLVVYDWIVINYVSNDRLLAKLSRSSERAKIDHELKFPLKRLQRRFRLAKTLISRKNQVVDVKVEDEEESNALNDFVEWARSDGFTNFETDAKYADDDDENKVTVYPYIVRVS